MTADLRPEVDGCLGGVLLPSAGFTAVRRLLYCPPQEWFYGAVPNENLAESLNGKLHRLFSIALIAWVILMGFRPMMDNVDLGWHVAQGRWMVAYGEFYRHDVFNYPNGSHAVVDEYPLFQVILFVAWNLGWWGPCLLTALAYTLLVSMFLRSATEFNLGASALVCCGVGLMFLYLQTVFPLRPHIATYLGVAAFGIFLLRHRESTRWTELWPLALIEIAWVNSHSGFVVGPAMVGLFGLEMTVRKWTATRTVPWITIRTWFCAVVLVVLACFVNPYGWDRFYLPFYQDSLESIRAYVGEMEPLSGGMEKVFADVTVIAVLVLVVALITRKGATAYSFLLLAIFFYVQAQSVQKAWPVFGVFIPLVILGGGAFSTSLVPPRPGTWLNAAGHFLVTVIAGMVIVLALDSSFPTSLAAQWREHDHGRSEMSVRATEWMKAHAVEGRLFHRCEDGGWLQQAGYDNGETFADTGFGKYNEAFIHEVGLVNERPALVPHYLAAYNPDFVVCSTFCYQWPYYLRLNGWRLIFYSPNSSVWTRPETRPDLPTVRNNEITSAFDNDIAVNGMPKAEIFGRNIIALNSHGLEDFSFAKLTGLPKEDHRAPWYWETARFLCFAEPSYSAEHRDALFQEAESLQADAVTVEFRAYYKYYAAGDADSAWQILKNIPPLQLSNYEAELLLRIELDRKLPEALALARRSDCFDLRNGHHWQYLAQAEEQFGSLDAARTAWRKAVFYYPDDPALMKAASDFAAKHNDAELAHDIKVSGDVYSRIIY